MSTTVTYKGTTLATVTNQTKTLKTAGKYLEGDVIITDSGGGGASNMVEGTFTTGDTAGSTDINIPYTGTGYPIAGIVVVEGGAYVSGTPWYNSVQRFAVGLWAMTKSDFSLAPTYDVSDVADENKGVIASIYKNTSSPTAYDCKYRMAEKIFSPFNATKDAALCVRMKANNILSYCVKNDTSYGLHPNMTYRYIIFYSS